jgi:uncharacterized phage-associated protein
MVNVFDVSVSILRRTGPISAMKLQKLIYYCQAWSLVWDDKPLFQSNIEAWMSGPVVRELYEKHRGKYIVSADDFTEYASKSVLSPEQQETINIVLRSYANKSAQWLSDQTHHEKPWQIAREGLSESDRGSNRISLESMAEYYSSI